LGYVRTGRHGALCRNDTLTCFRAKGDNRTKNLMIEWQEKDGSRWIGTVELTESWRSYALPPEAFQAWEPRNGRGSKGDRLQVGNAQRLVFGVAYSHMAIQGKPAGILDRRHRDGAESSPRDSADS